jgi:cell fate regulator YaaT (PSP1 superfamily)
VSEQRVFVRFRVPGDGAVYRAGEAVLRRGDRVIAETDRGLSVGTVLAERPVTNDPARPVTRVMTDADERQARSNIIREREAFTFCAEAIKRHGLSMKLVSVEVTHAGTRAIFYFSSDDRIDFRALVKDLAQRFQTRIEMRQIGVRDSARHTGGVGACGRELCCSTWLPEFQPISVKMAKDQNLTVNQDKLSGLCGRLRCCLQYEQSAYEAQRDELPKLGKRVVTPQGEGRVKDVNVLKRLVRVQLTNGSYTEVPAEAVTRPADVLEQMMMSQKAEAERAAIIAVGGTPPKRKRRKKRKPTGEPEGSGPQGQSV